MVDPRLRIRPLCSHDPAPGEVVPVAEGLDVVRGDAAVCSERARATAMAATCWPVISPVGEGAESAMVAPAPGVAAAMVACGTGDGSRSSRLRPLIDRASRASTTKTTPIPTRLTSSPSFSNSWSIVFVLPRLGRRHHLLAGTTSPSSENTMADSTKAAPEDGGISLDLNRVGDTVYFSDPDDLTGAGFVDSGNSD